MMMPLDKNASHWISILNCLTSYPNKKYLMAPWDSILIKKFELNSNQELCLYITSLILYPMYTVKPTKTT